VTRLTPSDAFAQKLARFVEREAPDRFHVVAIVANHDGDDVAMVSKSSRHTIAALLRSALAEVDSPAVTRFDARGQ
jgi:hypothetical protein